MAEETKKAGGLFGGGKPQKGPEGPSVVFLSQEITNLSTRLRVLEERSGNTKKKQEIVEQNMLSHRKKYAEEVDLLKEEIDEIRRQIKEIENRIIMIIKELRMSANKEDVTALKKYVELWEPVKFVTQNQVEKIVEEKIEELKATKQKGK
jgi:hypothetical protein